MLTAAQTAASVSEKKKTYSPRKSAPPKTTVTSYREAVSPTEEEKIKAGAGLSQVAPTIYTEPSGRPVQSSEEAVISGTVSQAQRDAERAATFAFYKGESSAEVQRSATDAYRKSVGLPPLEASTPFATSIVSGGAVFGSDVYDPQYASLSDRATTEHVMALADELGMPDKQPKTNAEKAEAMALRKELVAKLESEGIDSGLAWSLARQASYNKYEPSRFKKLYGVDVGTSLKPFESERIMDELKALKSNLSFKSGALADKWQSIQDKYKAMGDFRGGKGLTQAPISGGLEPGYRSGDSVMSEQLRDQYQLFSAQSTYLGRYIKRAESGKRVTTTDALRSIVAPESLLPKLQGTTEATYAGKGSMSGKIIPEVTEPTYVGYAPTGYVSSPSCAGGVCLPPSVMAQATVNPFANVQAKGVTRTTTPSVYQGIAGSDVDVYGNTLVAGVVKKDSDYFKGATAKGVVHRPGGASDTGNLFSGAFAYGQGAYAGRGGFHEFGREFMTGGSAVTSRWNRPMLEQEFAEHSSFDKKAALGNARQALEIEWARNQLSPIDQKEKATWLKTVGYEYDLAAADAKVQGQYLDESKDEFLARVSKEYDTGVRDYYNSPANREAWVQENLADYNKQLDEKAASGRIELYDDSGNLVFRGDKEQYINYRLASEPSTGSLAKSYGISSIPVYGTYKYIKQASKDGFTPSEIGWSIASVGADIAMIVPPIGAAARSALKPAIAGATASSRIANIARSFKTAGSMFKIKPAIIKPSFKGLLGGVKTIGKEYWTNLKYPFTKTGFIETPKAIGGLMTGSRIYSPVPVGFKGTINEYARQQMAKLKPGDVQPRVREPVSQLGEIRYKTVTPYSSATDTMQPSGVIRRTVYPGTQGMQVSKSATGRTVLEWRPGVASGEVLEQVYLTPEQQLLQAGKGASGKMSSTLQFSPTRRWEYGMGISAETGGGLNLSPGQLAFLERYHFQPSSFSHPSWMRIEPVSDWSPYRIATQTRTAPAIGGGVTTAQPSTATMTMNQLARQIGASPVSQIAYADVAAISSPIRPSIFPTVVPTVPAVVAPIVPSVSPGIFPTTVSQGIFPISSSSPYPYIYPASTPSPMPMPSPVISPIPPKIETPIPDITITSPVPPPPQPPRPPEQPIPIIPPPELPGLGGGSPIIGGGEGIQDLGYWEFGDMYAGVHPLTGKLVTVRAKKRIRYGDVPRTVYRSKVIRSKISGSTNSDTPFYKEEYAA